MVSPGNCTAPIPRSSLPGGRVAAVLLLLAPACVREPLGRSCPELAVGDLVISELRGPQGGSYHQWIELYNASDDLVTISGLRLRFINLVGSSTLEFQVRGDLEVEPGDYVVLGGIPPREQLEDAPYIDYNYTPDFHVARKPDDPPGTQPGPRSLAGSAVLELRACDVVIDHVYYLGLPGLGTLSLDGAAPPAADANDKTDAGWCIDDRETVGPKTETGIRGTPGEANLPCP